MLKTYNTSLLEHFGLSEDLAEADITQIENLIAYLLKRNGQLSVIRETAVRHVQANKNGVPYPDKLENIIINTISEW